MIKKIKAIPDFIHASVIVLRKNSAIPWGFIFALMLSDFFTMRNMFSPATTGSTKNEQFLYSFVLALCLEGLPVVIGKSLNTIRDTTTYKANEKENARYGLIASSVGSLIAVGLVFGIRIAQILKNGGYSAYKENEYKLFVIHCALCVLPFLTSLLAFAISWMFLRSERIDEQEKKVDICYRDYLRKEQIFSEKLHKLQEQRTALWTSVTNYLPIPTTLETFRREVVTRIRSRLMYNSIICFQAEINDYNAMFEEALVKYLTEMSVRSTIPIDIISIDIKELFDEYDKQCTNDIDKWSSDATICALDKELRALCHNDIIVEQAYVASGKEPIERKSML